jgi:hypothetical protein
LLGVEALRDTAAQAIHGAVDVQVIERRAMAAGAALERRFDARPQEALLGYRLPPARLTELTLTVLTAARLERSYDATTPAQRKLPCWKTPIHGWRPSLKRVRFTVAAFLRKCLNQGLLRLSWRVA